MTTLADLVERTRTHLYTETRDEKNRLTTGIGAADTTLDFDFDAGGIQRGAALCIGSEQMHVWSISGSTATVARGQAGTTASTHATGDLIYVNPKVSTPQIIGALNDDLIDLSSSGLYQTKTVTFTYDPGTVGYDLTGVTNLLGILEVTFDELDGTNRFSTLDPAFWRLRRNQPTADFSSGLALIINGYVAAGAEVTVVYKTTFSPLVNLTDNVLTVAGLGANLHDLPPLGAALNLTVGAEIARNWLNQRDTRRADEVPAGARMGSMRAVAARRAQRIADEVSRLYALYPTVRS